MTTTSRMIQRANMLWKQPNKLLLAPGAAQFYGDETARSLVQPQAQGDAVAILHELGSAAQ